MGFGSWDRATHVGKGTTIFVQGKEISRSVDATLGRLGRELLRLMNRIR